jgi:hypothetical protein
MILDMQRLVSISQSTMHAGKGKWMRVGLNIALDYMNVTDLSHRCLWLFQFWLWLPTPNCISVGAKNAGKFAVVNCDWAKFWFIIGNCGIGEVCVATTGERVVVGRGVCGGGFQFWTANQHSELTAREGRKNGKKTYILLPFTIQLLQLSIKDTAVFEILKRLIQPERTSSVLDRIVRVSLNMFMQDEPGQETQWQSPLTGR